ncbi:MAG: HAD family phosphatase [Dehalococcoidia bacterium]|nr:HAD family phosphatase [Dehalococcoidia bacterium]
MGAMALATKGSDVSAPPRLTAVVTDLDGVLCDTETVLVSAINRFLAEESQEPLTYDEARTMTGFDNDSWWRGVGQFRPSLNTPLDEYTHRVDMIARTLFPTELVVADGAIELVAAIHQTGVPFALATSARAAWAGQRLEIMGISDAFDQVLTADDVSAHKPNPEIYLKATQALGVDPAETLAIEDSPSGIRAARDAGLYTIAIRTHWMRDVDQTYAHVIVDSLRDIDLDALLAGGD